MTATTNIALKVPFNEKDQAKSLGARWNAESKHWYIPQGIDAAPFEKWLTNEPTSVPTQLASKTTALKTDKATPNQSIDDDIDAINARLRDAYEQYEKDAF